MWADSLVAERVDDWVETKVEKLELRMVVS